ncbi:hypothetical protein BDV25DRAFT_154007 [Aspergillus avenaceus]|uniref:deuterolysin n=1 Tax=Aspergillus avenaceus TaxID=36643 RepID=A0A5N6TW60_ASPAV|nr:hypothetical protein BDV25DRAFT_154007 [Aspergillus avenaceus]
MRFFQALLALPLIAGNLAAVANPIEARATLENCTSERKQMIDNALAQAAKMAKAGADALRSESEYSNSLFYSFFKTNDNAAKNRVAGVLDRIAKEALAGDKGVVTYFCTPEGIDCPVSEAFTVTAYGETDGTCDVLDQATWV